MVTDQRPGPAGAVPTNLTPFQGRLYYAAHDDSVGVELFSIDTTRVSRTVTGSSRGDIWHVIRRGDRIEVHGRSGRLLAANVNAFSELVLDTRGGNDTIIVDAGGQDLRVRLRIVAGRGDNSLLIRRGTVQVAGGADGGSLDVTVAARATLITSLLDATSLTILGNIVFESRGGAGGLWLLDSLDFIRRLRRV